VAEPSIAGNAQQYCLAALQLHFFSQAARRTCTEKGMGVLLQRLCSKWSARSRANMKKIFSQTIEL
jgi:hypothetical protein